jgi:hypothetical protein
LLIFDEDFVYVAALKAHLPPNFWTPLQIQKLKKICMK